MDKIYIDSCRLCLCSTDNKMNILDNGHLLNKIRECVSIEIMQNEKYPKFICDDCLNKIESWYIFKIMCSKSKTVLETQVNSKENVDCLFLGSNPATYQPKNKDEQRISKNSLIIDDNENSKNTTLKLKFEPQSCLNTNSNNEVESIFMTSDAECASEIEGSPCKKTDTYLGNNIFSCDFCTNTFEYYTDYLDHQYIHNGEVIYNCDKCKRTFSTRQDLALHEKKHKFPCHICGTRVQKQSMKLHLNKHTDKFKCTYCSLTFTCGPLLQEHVSARHMKLKQHFCDSCGKDFATRSSLNLHLKTHSDEKQYKCSKCNYAGRTSISLRIHMSKHENGTYICEYCSKIFKSTRNLGDHLRRVHKSNKKYSCEFCNMKFALRYLVVQHLRTHTGINPYKCPKCFKTFARSDGLKEHMNTHDRTESYKCELCQKIFRTKRGLKRHNCILDVKSEAI